ncbi:MAG: hypothetical protein ABJC04_11885 [Verrucomicrobiota bacterium]
MRKLILISVLLNLGLAGALAYFAAQPKKNILPPPSASETKTGKNLHAKTKRGKERSQTLVVNEPGQRFDWRDVESADYREYIANLRKIQCPEETIRDIIVADVNKFYAEQLKPLRKPPEEYRYWRNDQNWGGRRENDEFYALQRKIEKEKRVLLRELLGTDYEDLLAQQYGYTRPKDEFTQSLSQDVKDQLSEIQQKFSDSRNDIYRKAKGYMDQDSQTELKKIEKQQHDEMAKILSPEDLLEWQLRHSQTAQNLKWNELEGFNASEDEFRAVFKAKMAADEARLANPDDLTKEERLAQSKAQKEIQDGLKAEMGEDRYKEYELNQSWDYKELARIAERQGVAKEDVQKVYAMKDDVQKAARQVNSDKNLTPDQKREKLLQIKAATESEVTSTLGERGYKQWKRNAWWLRNIIPPEPKAVPK